MIELRFKVLRPEAQIPTRANPTDSGLDLYAYIALPAQASRSVFLEPEETLVINTGVAAELYADGAPASGVELQVRPRSGLSSKGLWVAFGTVDVSFRGELRVTLSNQTRRVFEVRHGDRIAQLVVVPVIIPHVVQVEELSPTPRGSSGFGSTGR